MTENGAINYFYKRMELGDIENDTQQNVYEMAIEALEEIQKYHEIGTVEECRSAVEKHKAKKVLKPLTSYSLGTCPVCTEHQLGRWEHCRSCGQKFDWSDEE